MNNDILIETPRLLLRKKVVEDAPFFLELNSNPLVVQYTGDGPFANLQEAEDIVRYVINQYDKNGYGRLMVVEKETGNPIGWCGLKYHYDTLETDLGYRFLQTQWGKGFATEASLACVDYGFNILKLKRIIGNAMLENTASINVLKKVGMTFLKNTLLHDVPSITYEIKKDIE
jgi:RimJ/RimL family protein N-acetyltransferase